MCVEDDVTYLLRRTRALTRPPRRVYWGRLSDAVFTLGRVFPTVSCRYGQWPTIVSWRHTKDGLVKC
jgi:hypothetical protein